MWFSSYLTNRKHYIGLNDEKFSLKTLLAEYHRGLYIRTHAFPNLYY